MIVSNSRLFVPLGNISNIKVFISCKCNRVKNKLSPIQWNCTFTHVSVKVHCIAAVIWAVSREMVVAMVEVREED